jgi:flagellar FliJ protein
VSAFRLDGLLRLRRLEEDRAAADLARANAERRRAEERRDATADAIGSSALDRADFAAAVAGRAALFGLYAESVAYLASATERAEQAGAEWTDARRTVRMLDKLAERHEAAEAAAELRAEQLLLDEAALRRPDAPPTQPSTSRPPTSPPPTSPPSTSVPPTTEGER